ncbi:RHOMBOID-like protein 12, mitochondrial isoform X3 [Tasmannia lanceolata]|uniref:RHOMBOID-like protein 12, mitochondrial isoform X3 n=1 Tax=Tasmannia lanceolata TaxID=3420 RepID=UPI0040629B9B
MQTLPMGNASYHLPSGYASTTLGRLQHGTGCPMAHQSPSDHMELQTITNGFLIQWEVPCFTRSKGGVQLVDSKRMEKILMKPVQGAVAQLFSMHMEEEEVATNPAMVSIENIASGRFHTLVTSAFSHVKLSHLFSNMFGLYFFGSNIGHQFGPKFLVKLYLAGAIAGSICFLAHMAFLIASSKDTRTFYLSPKIITGLGASGALNSIILLHIFLFPKATHYVNLIIPVPAMLLGALLIGTDIWRMLEGDSHIAGSAHLGGTLVAVLVWARIKKRWI